MSKSAVRLLAVAVVGFIILLVVVLASVALLGFDPAKYGTNDHDITYCTTDGLNLGMDLYYPKAGGPWPVLVFVHGGSWMSGDKAGIDTSPRDSGYLLVSINYRMYPDYQFPAMIEDIKCAVRSLRANARQYNLDPDRIALAGHSAGGHLVALAGLADKSAGWDTGQYSSQSSRVQAVVVIAGPTDLNLSFPGSVKQFLQNVFGSDQLVAASPVSHASPDDPPFFIIHGDADRTVPVEQAYLLKSALDEAGVPNDLVIVKGGGHALEQVSGSGSPIGEEAIEQALIFLEHYLKSSP